MKTSWERGLGASLSLCQSPPHRPSPQHEGPEQELPPPAGTTWGLGGGTKGQWSSMPLGPLQASRAGIARGESLESPTNGGLPHPTHRCWGGCELPVLGGIKV